VDPSIALSGPWGTPLVVVSGALRYSVSRRFRALGVDLPIALSGYLVRSVMEALQGLNPPA
jgi:hypothetical protein